MDQYRIITGLTETDASEWRTDFWIECTKEVFDWVEIKNRTNELQINSVISFIDDTASIILFPLASLEIWKTTALSMYEKEYFAGAMGNKFYIVALSFMLLNTELSSKGYFITDDNREEQYLNILNTGDTDLIEKLEQYLVHMDKINEIKHNFNSYFDLSADLASAIDYKDINKLFKDKTGKSLIEKIKEEKNK